MSNWTLEEVGAACLELMPSGFFKAGTSYEDAYLFIRNLVKLHENKLLAKENDLCKARETAEFVFRLRELGIYRSLANVLIGEVIANQRFKYMSPGSVITEEVLGELPRCDWLAIKTVSNYGNEHIASAKDDLKEIRYQFENNLRQNQDYIIEYYKKLGID